MPDHFLILRVVLVQGRLYSGDRDVLVGNTSYPVIKSMCVVTMTPINHAWLMFSKTKDHSEAIV